MGSGWSSSGQPQEEEPRPGRGQETETKLESGVYVGRDLAELESHTQQDTNKRGRARLNARFEKINGSLRHERRQMDQVEAALADLSPGGDSNKQQGTTFVCNEERATLIQCIANSSSLNGSSQPCLVPLNQFLQCVSENKRIHSHSN